MTVPNTETFNNTNSWIARGCNVLAEPTSVFLTDDSIPEDICKAVSKLNHDDIYVITLEGKTRAVTFERWHGCHALFYSPFDDWRFIIYFLDLRKLVKRRK